MFQKFIRCGALLGALSFSSSVFAQTPLLVKDVENPAHFAIRVSKALTFNGGEKTMTEEVDFGVPGKASIIKSINVSCVFTGDATLELFGPILSEKIAGNTNTLWTGRLSDPAVRGTTVRQWMFHGGMYTIVKPAALLMPPQIQVDLGRAGNNLPSAVGNCTLVVSGHVVP